MWKGLASAFVSIVALVMVGAIGCGGATTSTPTEARPTATSPPSSTTTSKASTTTVPALARFTGSGNDVVAYEALKELALPALLHIEYDVSDVSGEQSHLSVEAVATKADGESRDVLVNTSSSYKGTHALKGLMVGEHLEIKTTGSEEWIIEVRPWASMRTVDLDTSGKISGQEDEVIMFTGTDGASVDYYFGRDFVLDFSWEADPKPGGVATTGKHVKGNGGKFTSYSSPGTVLELHCTGTWTLKIEPSEPST